MHKNIILRSKVISFIRREMVNLGFLGTDSILTSSSPEGAKFLVPSRLNQENFMRFKLLNNLNN